VARRVRIQSDGTGCGTTITDLDTGALVRVTSAEIKMEVGSVNVARLTVLGPTVDVVTRVDAIEGECPICGRQWQVEDLDDAKSGDEPSSSERE